MISVSKVYGELPQVQIYTSAETPEFILELSDGRVGIAIHIPKDIFLAHPSGGLVHYEVSKCDKK